MWRVIGAVLLLAFCGPSCGGPDPDPESQIPYDRYLGVKELGEENGAADVVPFLDDPHFLVVVGALEALAEIGHPEVAQHGVASLTHDHPFVREHACILLGSIGNNQAIPHLVEMLSDKNTRVQRAAIRALAAFGKRDEVVKPLIEIVGNKDPSVSLMAHDMLQKLTGREDVPQSRKEWAKVLP